MQTEKSDGARLRIDFTLISLTMPTTLYVMSSNLIICINT